MKNRRWEQKFGRDERVRTVVGQNIFVDAGAEGVVIGTWTEGFKGAMIGGFRVVFDCLVDHPQAGRNYRQVGTCVGIDDIVSV